MGYKITMTTNRVFLVQLHGLTPRQRTLCEQVRAEAGRCWSDLVAAHVAQRARGEWLSDPDLRAMTKGGAYRLHSQSVQALGQKLLANVATARGLRVQQAAQGVPVTSQYPYKSKPYQTVTWKDQAIRRERGTIVLPNGRGQPDLVLPLPARYQQLRIRKAELLWRADHYELALTVDAPIPAVERRPPQVAGIDLGEINIAAAVTQDGQGLILNGRYLRSIKQLRNKRHAELTSMRDRCTEGSRRWKRLQAAKARASAQFYRQQGHVLHTASRRLVHWLVEHGAGRVAVGDVRNIAKGTERGRMQNQKLSQWAHGQFVAYLTYKARALGITIERVDEAYSTRTCSACGQVKSCSPRGRVYRCGMCHTTLNRDANGAANICSTALTGQYGNVQPVATTYRRATDVAPRTRARLRRLVGDERVAG